MEPNEPTLQAKTKGGAADLRSFLSELEEADLTAVVTGGWTVSAVLAHLAFWDRWVVERWDSFQRTGSLDDLPDTIVELINAAAEPLWLALPPATARVFAVTASESVNETIQALGPAAVHMALETGRLHMLDRTRHWNAHMTEVQHSLTSPA